MMFVYIDALALLAFHGQELVGRDILLFIDNEAASIRFIRAHSPVPPSLRLFSACVDIDGMLRTL